MKHMSLIFVLAFMAAVSGCQDSKSKKSSSSSNSLNCQQSPSSYGCPQYCIYYPTGLGCNNTTGNTTGGGTDQTVNPFPNYSSSYANISTWMDQNWLEKYPYIPSIQNCPAPTSPSGISYTPYETRKGTVTVVGKGFNPIKNPDPMSWYDPRSYTALPADDKSSPLLTSVTDALKFFYTDTVMKVRIKANLQPDSRSSNPYCYGRVPDKSIIKGYTKLKLDLYLVGVQKDDNGKVITYYNPDLLISDMTISANYCSSVIDLASFNGVNYPSKYPDGFFLIIKNVRGNQNWSPGTQAEQQAYNTYGFYPNSKYDGNSYMQAIRSNDCWSVDIEVAADGTKTF